MKFSGRSLAALAMVSMLSIFIGCGGGGGSGSSGGSSTGTVSMSITDAKPVLPDNVTNCFVTIDEVSVHSSEGGWETLEMVHTPYTIDLLQFTDGVTAEFVPPARLSSGKYTQVRLSVLSASLRFNGDPIDDVELTIPSANLKTDKNFDFDVTEKAAVDITIDFDLSKSIVVEGPAANPSYKLKPVLHIVDTLEAATIEGFIDNDLIPDEGHVVISVLDSTGDEYTKLKVEKMIPKLAIIRSTGLYRIKRTWLGSTTILVQTMIRLPSGSKIITMRWLMFHPILILTIRMGYSPLGPSIY